jgi:hypothetical protein
LTSTRASASRQPPPRVHPEPDPDPDAKGSLRPWTVVTIWAVLLGLPAAVSAGFGNNLVVPAISGGAAVLVLLVAGSRRHADAESDASLGAYNEYLRKLASHAGA